MRLKSASILAFSIFMCLSVLSILAWRGACARARRGRGVERVLVFRRRADGRDVLEKPVAGGTTEVVFFDAGRGAVAMNV
jgi:hypothetical protein